MDARAGESMYQYEKVRKHCGLMLPLGDAQVGWFTCQPDQHIPTRFRLHVLWRNVEVNGALATCFSSEASQPRNLWWLEPMCCYLVTGGRGQAVPGKKILFMELCPIVSWGKSAFSFSKWLLSLWAEERLPSERRDTDNHTNWGKGAHFFPWRHYLCSTWENSSHPPQFLTSPHLAAVFEVGILVGFSASRTAEQVWMSCVHFFLFMFHSAPVFTFLLLNHFVPLCFRMTAQPWRRRCLSCPSPRPTVTGSAGVWGTLWLSSPGRRRSPPSPHHAKDSRQNIPCP